VNLGPLDIGIRCRPGAVRARPEKHCVSYSQLSFHSVSGAKAAFGKDRAEFVPNRSDLVRPLGARFSLSVASRDHSAPANVSASAATVLGLRALRVFAAASRSWKLATARSTVPMEKTWYPRMVVVSSKSASSAPQRRYLRTPIAVYFPEAETVPETGVHFRVRTALWSMIRLAFGDRMTVGSDQFLYWDPTDPRQCLAPDVLVWVGAPDRPFSSWKVWERGAPHLAIEVISSTDQRDRHWEKKLAAYQRSGVLELVRFHPEDAQTPLRLWDRVEGDLVERRVSRSELERSDLLGSFWLVEPSTELGLMLRLCRDSAGRERLLTDEEAHRAEAEAHRAEAEAHRAAEARIRELEAQLALRSAH
jgi:putative restriction endonuclease